MVADPAELIRKVAAKYRLAGGGLAVHEEGAYALDGKEPTYHGDFWVLAEREGEGIKSVSLELLGVLGRYGTWLRLCRLRGPRPTLGT